MADNRKYVSQLNDDDLANLYEAVIRHNFYKGSDLGPFIKVYYGHSGMYEKPTFQYVFYSSLNEDRILSLTFLIDDIKGIAEVGTMPTDQSHSSVTKSFYRFMARKFGYPYLTHLFQELTGIDNKFLDSIRTQQPIEKSKDNTIRSLFHSRRRKKS